MPGPWDFSRRTAECKSAVVQLRQPDAIDDPLTEVLEAGARRLLTQAVELGVDAILGARAGFRLPDKRARLVRHGHGPACAAQTGAGVGDRRSAACLDDIGGENATFALSLPRDTMNAGAEAIPFGHVGLGLVTTGSTRDKLSTPGAKRSSAPA